MFITTNTFALMAAAALTMTAHPPATVVLATAMTLAALALRGQRR